MLLLKNISRSFPGVRALTNVNLQFFPGEVHALCGENGAGKSTLMNIICGNLHPDSGTLTWKDKTLTIDNVAEARALGIGIVYQEQSLVNALSVAENIFIKPPLSRFGWIDYSTLYKMTAELVAELKLKGISPKMHAGKLSPAQKKMIEIARAISMNPSLLILDEPTASLTHDDKNILFDIIHKLRAKGVAIIYISHRMDEIREISDKVSILKDGCYQGTFNTVEIDTAQIISKMVGRDLILQEYESHKTNELVLEINDLSGSGFHNVNLKLHKGEIIGLAGLLGSGRTALALGIFGDNPAHSGKMVLHDQPFHPRHPSDAIQNGIAYIPDDRLSLGLFIEKNISENIASTGLASGWYDMKKNDNRSEAFQKKLGIRATSIRGKVQKLSGGNQQKVMMAKWLALDPQIMIINEPTHGVDVGAKAEIYRELRKLTLAGKSVLLISSELTELFLLSDRIAVMYNGTIRAIVDNKDASEELVTRIATGM